MGADDSLERIFEGRQVLDSLLSQCGSLADTEDVYGAFVKAAQSQSGAAVVIDALWEDEPRFSSPEQARRLFSNLLGLFALVESGQKVRLDVPKSGPIRAPKASKPKPFGQEGPSDDDIAAALRYFSDWPKEFVRFSDAFDNKQDALLTCLDEAALADDVFAIIVLTLKELFAVFELSGLQVGSVSAEAIRARQPGDFPPACARWIDESLVEAQAAETGALSAEDAAVAKKYIDAAVAAAWANARRHR
jgi:hypothetical protein